MTRLFALLFATCAIACSRPSVMVKRPEDKKVDEAVTQMWTSEIGNVARDGDWILTRSYVLVGDAISTVVPGESLSHASIYDAKTGTVIEAVSEGIREIPLSKLVGRNHYVIVVRPVNMTAAEQTAAVARARTKIGGKFDISGMFGIDHKQAFYCSELVYWASETEARSGRRERIITPSNLMKYGEVIYWSGKRDDSQVMSLAASRSQEQLANH